MPTPPELVIGCTSNIAVSVHCVVNDIHTTMLDWYSYAHISPLNETVLAPIHSVPLLLLYTYLHKYNTAFKYLQTKKAAFAA